MMNQTLQDLKTRRSCRRYRPEQIKESELEQILEAGVFAPTGMGMQSPKIVVVQDKETIEELSKMNAKIMGVTSDPFYGAPTVLIVLADKNRSTYLEDGSLSNSSFARWIQQDATPTACAAFIRLPMTSEPSSR